MISRARVCYHEAGHHCACCVYAVPVVGITIDSEQPDLYHGEFLAAADIGLEALVVICLSGAAAVQHFFGNVTPDSDHGDIAQARQLLSRRYNELEIGLQLSRYRSAAERLVRTEQARIKTIAELLIERGSLTGEQIAMLWERPRPPAGARDVTSTGAGFEFIGAKAFRS